VVYTQLKLTASSLVFAQGFNLKTLKHLVLDEADKLLDMDFEAEIDQILKVIPR
jgi:ATP-dependent RNA helicase DDX47/RRP3